MLDANATEQEIVALGYKIDSWEWGLTAPRRVMLETIVMAEYHHIYRGLWRSHVCSRDGTPNLLVCPDSGSCARRRTLSSSTPLRGLSRSDDDTADTVDEADEAATCACSVPGIADAAYDWQNVYYCVVDDDYRALFDSFMPPLLLRELTVMLATTSVLEGDIIDTAGLGDMAFWLMAPTIERLLAAKRLSDLDEFASVKFAKWDSYDGANETWLSYSYYSQAEGENSFYPDEYTCVGHGADDAVLDASLPLQGGVARYDSDGDGIVSNWEFFTAINPNRDDLDSVFASFDWEHCQGRV